MALLVARGLTNREIAATLFLSPKTVEHHLSERLPQTRLPLPRPARACLPDRRWVTGNRSSGFDRRALGDRPGGSLAGMGEHHYPDGGDEGGRPPDAAWPGSSRSPRRSAAAGTAPSGSSRMRAGRDQASEPRA